MTLQIPTRGVLYQCDRKHLAKTTVNSNRAVHTSLKDLTLYLSHSARGGVFVLLDPLAKIQLNLVSTEDLPFRQKRQNSAMKKRWKKRWTCNIWSKLAPRHLSALSSIITFIFAKEVPSNVGISISVHTKNNYQSCNITLYNNGYKFRQPFGSAEMFQFFFRKMTILIDRQ